MKFCPNCGNELRKGSIFCDKCGNPVSDNTNDKSNINKISKESISEDIASNVELMPILIGVVVCIIPIVIYLLNSYYSIVLYIGIGMCGAISGFLTNNSTLYAIIYGAIVGFISSFLYVIIYSILCLGFLSDFSMLFHSPIMPFFMVLGVFGGFVGKVVKPNLK